MNDYVCMRCDTGNIRIPHGIECKTRKYKKFMVISYIILIALILLLSYLYIITSIERNYYRSQFSSSCQLVNTELEFLGNYDNSYKSIPKLDCQALLLK